MAGRLAIWNCHDCWSGSQSWAPDWKRLLAGGLGAPLLGYFPLLYDYFLRLLWTTETTYTSTFGYLLSISLPFFYLLMDISGGELLELKELLLIGDLYHLFAFLH